MTRTRPLAALAALILTLAPALARPVPAQAQTQAPALAPAAAPRMVGAKVVDAKGKTAGPIERVIAGPDGRPLQVLVRVDHILRTLPVDALTPSGAKYASVLSRAEIAALPPSE